MVEYSICFVIRRSKVRANPVFIYFSVAPPENSGGAENSTEKSGPDATNFFCSMYEMSQWHPVWVPENHVKPCNSVTVPQMAITFCRGLSYPTRSLRRIVCRRQERPNGRKGTLRPDCQASTRPRFFKSQFHHKIQEDSCEEFQV